MPFENNVRERRLALKMSQDELATKAQTNRITIARLESQRIEPPASTMYRIARALGAEFEDVFHYIEEKPQIITRAARVAADAAKTLATMAVCLIVLLVFAPIGLRAAGAYQMNQHNPQAAQMDYEAANFFANPLIYRGRMEALQASQTIRIGMGRGYLTPLPTLDQCRAWLVKYDAIVTASDPSEILGQPLHLAYADCLDRVAATREAVAERERILATHDFILAHSEPMDFYLTIRQASLAYQMHDDAAAVRLAALAHDTHPDLYAKMLRMWANAKSAPIDVRELQAINRQLAVMPLAAPRI